MGCKDGMCFNLLLGWMECALHFKAKLSHSHFEGLLTSLVDNYLVDTGKVIAMW